MLPMRLQMYGGLEKVILASRFWEEDNVDSEFHSSKVYDMQYLQTDAARSLQLALQRFFLDNNMQIAVFVTTLDQDFVDNKSLTLQTNENPNIFIVAASAGLTGKKDKLLLDLQAVESSHDFDSKNVNPNELVTDIAQTIRHELVHNAQYDKVAAHMGISRARAKQKFEDWNLIPMSNTDRTQYLSAHIELDAFGHEFAERLAHHFGVSRSLVALDSAATGGLDELAQRVNLGANFEEFFGRYSNTTFTSQLVKKIQKYLKLFQHHGIYETKHCDAGVGVKITKGRLSRLILEVIDQGATRERLVRGSNK